MIDRTETARALAKAIAHKHAGNHDQADVWAARLVRLLECEGILTATAASTAPGSTGSIADWAAARRR